jgi:hypothetical protein
MHVTEKTCIERDSIMSSKSKREYLEAIYLRYRRSSRKKKAVILDEFCAACGYHRSMPSGFSGSSDVLSNSPGRRQGEHLYTIEELYLNL